MSPYPHRILLVDDDPQALDSTRKILELAGYEVVVAHDGKEALEIARDRQLPRLDLVLTDVRMPKLGGLEFLRALSLCGETAPVILMTAFGRVEDAVWAMKLGAVDFLTKPFKRQALLAAVEAALKRSVARAAPHSASAQTASGQVPPPPFIPGLSGGESLVGRSRSMTDLKRMIAQVAPTAATVLITGESGTGKELVARSIHDSSLRSKGRFIALNCAAFPENLIESELFGFEKGAFTGATAAREGLFEAADGGTLLLDEIGDMPFVLQAKLLRTLQEGEVRRIGSTVSRKIDVRVLAATHRDLAAAVRAGSFRQDLLYRLEVVGIRVAPLRERAEDIPDLAYHFLKRAASRHGKSVNGISEEAMEILLSHGWPGNIRELSNVIERAVIFAAGALILARDLPPHLAMVTGAKAPAPTASDEAASRVPSSISVPIGTPLKEVEELLILKTLEATSGDKNMTARLLGINERTIYRKMGSLRSAGPTNEEVGPEVPENGG